MECAPEMEPFDRATETGAAASKWTWPERDRHSLPDCEKPVSDTVPRRFAVASIRSLTLRTTNTHQVHAGTGQTWSRRGARGRLGINQHTPPEAEGYGRVSSGVPKVKPSKNTSLVLLDWGLDGCHSDSLSPLNVQSGFMKQDAGCKHAYFPANISATH